jgi:putative sterol carrier protein
MTPSTVQEVFDGMPGAFRAHKAEGVQMVFQFHITGDESGDWSVSIADGQCAVSPGTHPDPTTTLTLSDKNWLKLVAGKLNPAMALMTGKLKIGGDMMAAQRLGSLFKLG